MSDRIATSSGRAGVCPFIALDDDRDHTVSVPDHRHRCFAESPAAPRALAHQAAYCLAPSFPACPTFIDWARREAAPPRDEPSRPAPPSPVGPVGTESVPRDRRAGFVAIRPEEARRPGWSDPPPWVPERPSVAIPVVQSSADRPALLPDGRAGEEEADDPSDPGGKAPFEPGPAAWAPGRDPATPVDAESGGREEAVGPPDRGDAPAEPPSARPVEPEPLAWVPDADARAPRDWDPAGESPLGPWDAEPGAPPRQGHPAERRPPRPPTGPEHAGRERPLPRRDAGPMAPGSFAAGRSPGWAAGTEAATGAPAATGAGQSGPVASAPPASSPGRDDRPLWGAPGAPGEPGPTVYPAADARGARAGSGDALAPGGGAEADQAARDRAAGRRGPVGYAPVADSSRQGRRRGQVDDVAAPAWERPRMLEDYGSLRQGSGRMQSLRRILMIVVLLAVAAFALPFAFRAIVGGGGGGAGSSPTPSASAVADPTEKPVPTPKPEPTPLIYVVKANDTLSKIAVKFGVTVDQILSANPRIKNPDRIKLGDQIIIPAAGASPIVDGGVTPKP